MSHGNQVVITGTGAVSPIGIGVQEFWDSLLAGKSGVRIRESLADTQSPLRLYSPVIGFDGKQWVRPRKALKVMCAPIQFGYTAAAMALEQSGIQESGIAPERLGTVFGSETFFADPMEVASVFRKCVSEQNYVHDRWGEFAMREIQPLWMLKYLPNMVTSHISIAADARGPSNSICQSEVSGLLALIEGADLIERGACDAVVVGGTGAQTSLSGMLYRGSRAMSKRNDHPEAAIRPFDLDRDGTVYGEGAGAIVLENATHASARGAKILGSLRGWSRGFNRFDSDDFQTAIKTNLEELLVRSDLKPEEIGHINAHGSASKIADRKEAQAIAAVLGDLPVTATKSNYGELGPGGATLELIASILALNEQTVPPTRNYQTPDPDCPINVVSEPLSCTVATAIKLSFSTTGQIASVTLSR